MNFADLMTVAVILLVGGSAGWYVFKAKKKGKKCIGCPDGGCCSGCGGNCEK